MRTPLHLRLPNLPTHAVGRADEIERLRGLIRQGPVACVWGPSGVGRRTLAQLTLHRHFKRRLDQIRVCQAPSPDLPVDQWLPYRLAEGASTSEPQGLPDPLAGALDLAEQHRWWVVVDVEGCPGAERLVDLCARYARHSKWLILSWRPLQGPALALGGLPPADLRALAQRVAPELAPEAVEAALQRSGGSPLRCVQWLAHMSGPHDHEADQDLDQWRADLSAEARAALDLLCHVRALPRAVMSPGPDAPCDEAPCDEPLCDEAAIRPLISRGLVESIGGRLRAHPVIQGAAPRDAALEARLAAALAARSEPACAVEALWIWGRRGQVQPMADLLQARGDELTGHAPAVWPLIAPLDTPALAPWRLRIAVALGTEEALATLSPTPPDDPDLRAVWARGTMIRGDPAAALAALGPDPLDPELAALCMMNLGRYAEALDTLPPSASFRGQVLRVLSLPHVEGRAPALSLAQRLTERAAADPEIPPFLIYDLARALLELGALPQARALVQLAQSRAHRWAPSPRHMVSLMIEAQLALHEGELAEARRALDRLAPLARPGGLIALSHRLIDLQRRLLTGAVEGLPEQLAQLRADPMVARAEIFSHAAAALDEQLGLLSGAPPLTPLPSVASDHRRELELLRCRRALRHGAPRAPGPRPDHPLNGLLHDLVEAEQALMGGALAVARRQLSALVAAAQVHGAGGVTAEALASLGDLHAVAGDAEALSSTAAQLAALAESMESPRYARRAQALAWMAHSAPRPLGPLAAFAEALTRVDPTSARRARAIWGCPSTPQDQLDAMVLAPLRADLMASISLHGGPDLRGLWGLDLRRSCVWQADGPEIQPSPLLWRLLLLIAEAGGALDKEALCLGAWDEPSYHPLRHDNRLHANVRKLRQLIEPDPDQPQRLLTTEAGYGFAQPWAWRR